MILTREIYHAVHTFAISIFKFIHFFVTFHGNQMAVLNTIHKPRVLIPLKQERHFRRITHCFCAKKAPGCLRQQVLLSQNINAAREYLGADFILIGGSEDLGQEGLQSLIGRIRKDLLRCSFLDDPAFVHEDHA